MVKPGSLPSLGCWGKADGSPRFQAAVQLFRSYRTRAMQSRPGTYVLVLRCRSAAHVDIGRWGRLCLGRGYYLYVGSARGPGGLRARVLRHFRKRKTKHWHIDYLRERTNAVGVWFRHGVRNREHQWARAIAKTAGMSPVKDFGCSDCGCYTHLFATANKPNFAQLAGVLGGAIGSLSYRRQAPKQKAKRF